MQIIVAAEARWLANIKAQETTFISVHSLMTAISYKRKRRDSIEVTESKKVRRSVMKKRQFTELTYGKWSIYI